MKLSIALVLAAAAVGTALAQTTSETEPSLSEIKAAAATTLPYSPTSKVQGLVFDRFVQVWLENTDYGPTSNNSNQQWFASQGVLLSNFWAVAHPSEPNYCAAAGGDNFGMDNDNFLRIPANISTIADLLDTKGISWGEYQEALPYPGFQGYNFSNQRTGASNYVRKHNPLILYDTITSNETRLRQIKNFTNFYSDIGGETLPQWAFVTPNMTNDAHDTNITFASNWERAWLSALIKNPYFWNNTLILLTFDETGTYKIPNNIFSVLLGGAVPPHLVGTTDNTFYTHFSSIASVSANWGLPSLGRWDCGANIFQLVAEKTSYVNYKVDTTSLYLNRSFSGPLSTNKYSKYASAWPNPVTSAECSAGHGILQQVQNTYGGLTPTYNYTSPFPYDAALGLGVGVRYWKEGVTYISGVNGSSIPSSQPHLPVVSSSAEAVFFKETSWILALLSGWFLLLIVYT